MRITAQSIGRLFCIATSLLLPVPGTAEDPHPSDVNNCVDITIQENVLYRTVGDTDLHLDIAWPTLRSGRSGRPAILFIHGGGWQAGTRQAQSRLVRAAARRGYVAATVTYRLAPQFTWPAQWEDVRAALIWLRENASTYGIDPERIGAAGHSAGGHLSLMLGGFPNGAEHAEARVQAVVNFFGPTDLAAANYGERARGIITTFIGGPVDAKQAEHAAASPLTLVTPGDAPTLTFHGTTDGIVPVEQAYVLHEAFAAARVPNELNILAGRGHGWRGMERRRTTHETFRFFDAYLKGSELPLLYADDFSSGAGGWRPTDDSAWRIEKEGANTVYALIKKRSDYETKVRSPFNYSRLEGVDVSDFVFDVRVQSTTPDYGHRDLCLFFGYQGPTRFYYVHLGKKADAHANSIFLVNDSARVSIARRRTDGTDWDDGWHRVRVARDVEHGTIDVYFDDMVHPVMHTVDYTFLHGEIGVGSFDDTGRFDVVRLRGRRAAESSVE